MVSGANSQQGFIGRRSPLPRSYLPAKEATVVPPSAVFVMQATARLRRRSALTCPARLWLAIAAPQPVRSFGLLPFFLCLPRFHYGARLFSAGSVPPPCFFLSLRGQCARSFLAMRPRPPFMQAPP